ncbi:MAG: 4Fe-4S dicluster domain-containing protein [Hydrogeniiclostridium sp.]
MTLSRKMANIGKECVACGCCVRVCPKEAIQIAWGISARVDQEKCIGCGKCAKVCPAAVIDIVERGAAQ